ncbi:MAG: hypothetical protein ACRC62_14350 [Microcoleus sp.]
MAKPKILFWQQQRVNKTAVGSGELIPSYQQTLLPSIDRTRSNSQILSLPWRSLQAVGQIAAYLRTIAERVCQYF